jgi:AcrR family transcriptional regulator
MPSPRPYDARGRRESAARNRASVLAACRELLDRDGFHKMTVRAVAERSGVSPETVYKSFGGKAGLAKSLWDVTLAGDDEPVAVAERPELQRVWSTVDKMEKLYLYAAFVRGVNQRVATLFAQLLEAGPEVAQVLGATEQERLVGVRAFVGHLGEANLLAPGRDASTAADACWALTGPKVYIDLTGTRAWAASRYQQWLAGILAATFF